MEDRVAGKTLTEKSRSSVERNARLSSTRRAKRPLPPTREEADELFRPASPNAHALGSRLYRMNELGLLHPDGGRLPRPRRTSRSSMLCTRPVRRAAED